MKLAIISLLILIISLSLTSAVVINSIDSPTLAPGGEGQIRIEVENNLDDDAKDVTLSLTLSEVPFIPIGTSTQSEEEIEEDEDERFIFRIRAANDIVPGDYEIPYTLTYKLQGEDERFSSQGTIGITVSADPDLTFSVSSEDAVIGRQGKITLRIVNRGFSDARFVSVRAIPEGFTILSDKEDYIGEIESDDFETVSFDALFKKKDARFQAIIEYKDFDNERVIKSIDLPLEVYTQEEAIELGIITPSRAKTYIITIILIIILIILWRWYRKRQRLRRSRRLEES